MGYRGETQPVSMAMLRLKAVALLFGLFALMLAPTMVCSVLIPLPPVVAVEHKCTTAADVAIWIERSYVQILAHDGSHYGTGNVINHNGTQYVMTAGHVCRNFKGPEGYNPVRLNINGTYHSGSVVAESTIPDIGLIKPDAVLPRVPLVFGGADVRQGETCYYTSNPENWYGMFDASIVHTANLTWKGKRYLSVGGCGWFGTSGAALYVLRDGKPVCCGVFFAVLWADAGKGPGLVETLDSVNAFLVGVK